MPLAKKLKELGIEQNAINTWIMHPEYPGENLLRAPYEFFAACDVDGTGRKYYSAFNVAELGEILLLPNISIITGRTGAGMLFTELKDIGDQSQLCVDEFCADGPSDTEANNRAILLIAIIESKWPRFEKYWQKN